MSNKLIRIARSFIHEFRIAREVAPISSLAKWMFAFYCFAGKIKWLAGREIKIKIRELDNRLICLRLGTSDFSAMRYVFSGKYHLPPMHWRFRPTRILDLGCNVGFTLLHYKSIYPAVDIIGVDMDEDNLRLARKNIGGRNMEVSIIHAAVTAQKGEVVYFQDGRHCDAYHINSKMRTEGSDGKAVCVTGLTIENILDEVNWEKIDYLKMDIEGEEINIFSDNSDLSWLGRVAAMNIEVHGDYDCAVSIGRRVERHGFKMECTQRDDQCVSLLLQKCEGDN